MSLPDIRVEEFKRELRRNLLNEASRYSQGPNWRFGFGLACAAALVFVFTSILFVFKPELPAQLNALMIRDGQNRRVPVVLTDSPDHLSDPYDPALQELINQGLSTDSDREFVKNWYRQQYPSHPFQIDSVEDEKIYAIRRFHLKDGKKVVVYTEVKGDDGLATY